MIVILVLEIMVSFTKEEFSDIRASESDTE